MNILIVGGAGYLGGAVTDLLMQSQHNIRVYDVLLYEETYRKQVPFVFGDIRDKDKLNKHFEWADVVIWLAALVGDPACELDEALTVAINRDSVQFLKDNFQGRIIFMSTCSIYGAQDELLSENSPLQPLSLYAQTKLWSEKILADAEALIFRLGTLYGISDEFSRVRFDLVVNTLVMRAAVHNKINVFGGQQYRPLLHVRDAAQTIYNTLEGTNTGIYNLHSENTTIIEIAQLVEKNFPGLQVEINETMFQDSRNYRVSSEKAKQQLHFDPTLTISAGIEELKQILEQGRIKNSFLTRFSNYLYLRPLLSEYSSPLGKLVKFNL
ncbi:MAG: NAD(P)-dependent oxidoreductase [Bacteroidetes bacterium]|nr:NAD(P)-dependent oxidoreductase [Bacteroidota bacterium]